MAEEKSSISTLESLLGDRYTREARIAPAFLSVFPVLIVALAWIPELRQIVPALLGLLCFFGVVRWISHIARGIGDKKEIELFQKWHGKPTTTMLRIYAGNLSVAGVPQTVQQLIQGQEHGSKIGKVLEKKLDISLPTKQEDAVATTAEALDDLYEPITVRLRENTRINKLVFEENISYGFQRNFFALKSFAVLCGVVSFAGDAVAVYLRFYCFQEAPTAAMIAVLLAIMTYLAGVLFFVSEESVQLQGFAYARQLINSVYVIEAVKTKQ